MSKIEYSEHIKSMHNLQHRRTCINDIQVIVIIVHTFDITCAEDFCSIIIEHVTKKQINCLRKFEGYTQ